MLTIVARLVPVDPTLASALQAMAYDRQQIPWNFLVPLCTVPKEPVIALAVHELHELPQVSYAIGRAQYEPVLAFRGLVKLDGGSRYGCQLQQHRGLMLLRSAIDTSLEDVLEILHYEPELRGRDRVEHTMLQIPSMLAEFGTVAPEVRRQLDDLAESKVPVFLKLDDLEVVDSNELVTAAA